MINLSRRIYLYLLVLVSVVTAAIGPLQEARAMDVDFYSGNNILFYSSDVACMTSNGSLKGNSNLEKIYSYLIGKGLNSAQAGGILGNIRAESGLSATRHEMGQAWDYGGYGLAQWTGSRRTQIVDAFKAFKDSSVNLMEYYKDDYSTGTSKDNGYIHKDLPVEISDRFLLIELDFLYQEATSRTVRSGVGTKGTSEWESITKAATLRAASDIWYYSFERPAVQNETNGAERARLGQEALDEAGANAIAPVDTSTSSCPQANGDVTALQSLVKEYAWPKYKGHGAIEPTKIYGDAIVEAQKNKLYVGGIKYPGIDCGGYVTRVVINSGWDPAYNYSGKGGATPTQQRWLDANWERLGHITDTSKLQSGDVAMEPGHTWIFVGTIDGFESNQSSASLDNRAPMASSSAEAAKATDSTTVWYRKKGA